MAALSMGLTNDIFANKMNIPCKVNAEIQSVVAMMRQNAKWSLTSFDDSESEDPLLQNFKILRRKLFSLTDWTQIPPLEYLSPFLDVIKSEKTNTPITGIALTSVYNILSLNIIQESSNGSKEAMHSIVESVNACRFEVTDQSSEEIVLMKILLVLSACLQCKCGTLLSDRDVCNLINIGFRIVHKSAMKSELLQRTACHTMQEMIRIIFSRLPSLPPSGKEVISLEEMKQNASIFDKSGIVSQTGDSEKGKTSNAESSSAKKDLEASTNESSSPPSKNSEKENDVNSNTESMAVAHDSQPSITNKIEGINGDLKTESSKSDALDKPYGISCMVEIFQFLCSLLSLPDQAEPWGEEEIPLLALTLIRTSLEVAGDAFMDHANLLSLVQDALFRNLLYMAMSDSMLILSLICNIVLLLYTNMGERIKLQLEAFFSFVIFRLAQGKYGASFRQQEVAMECLLDFFLQPNFLVEVYANYDCDISCSNLFEELTGLLCKNSFPVNSPLTAPNLLSLEALVTLLNSVADKEFVLPAGSRPPKPSDEDLPSEPFWQVDLDKFKDSQGWIDYVRKRKQVKRKLTVGVDHFNHDMKKGIEYFQGCRLLPEKLQPSDVANLFRFAPGLNKVLLGQYLGEPLDFNLAVLNEFTNLFDFTGLTIDGALRMYLESFRLQGEAQKIARILESFAGRYYEHCPQLLANKDTAYVLSYSVIMLNTDQHNVQVRKKMSEEDFIRNNRKINDGKDLPRQMLSDLYHSIAKNEIRMSEGSSSMSEMNYSRWTELIRRLHSSVPYLTCKSQVVLEYDMFESIVGPTIAAISVIFDHADEHDESVLERCISGFVCIAKYASHHRLLDVLDDLIIALCKFTNLTDLASGLQDRILGFGQDPKARLATVTMFSIVSKSGNHICNSWRNILECVVALYKISLLPSDFTSQFRLEEGSDSRTSASDSGPSPNLYNAAAKTKKSFGIMSRLGQFLSLEAEEATKPPSESQLAAHQHTLRAIEACQISSIFGESRFLETDALLHLISATIWISTQSQRSISGSYYHADEDEETAVFCLDLLYSLTLTNRDRVLLFWESVAEHVSQILKSATSPGPLVEKAVFGLLQICCRLLPYKDHLSERLLLSLKLVLDLDAKVADVFCERITAELLHLIKANASLIRSESGWETLCRLLAITGRHPEAGGLGFEALSFVFNSKEIRLIDRKNFLHCLEAARSFAEGAFGGVERSMAALDLMISLSARLQEWTAEVIPSPQPRSPAPLSSPPNLPDAISQSKGLEKSTSTDKSSAQDVKATSPLSTSTISDLWLRLIQTIRGSCTEPREEVRNYAISCLQRSILTADSLPLPPPVWAACFEQVIFVLLDDLLDIGVREKPKKYAGMEGSLLLAMKLLSKIFLHFLPQLILLPAGGFLSLWPLILRRMEMYFKAKLKAVGNEQLRDLIPELLKNILLVMHAKGIMQRQITPSGNSLWEMTWNHVQAISPSMKDELFPEETLAEKSNNQTSSLLHNKPDVQDSKSLTVEG